MRPRLILILFAIALGASACGDSSAEPSADSLSDNTTTTQEAAGVTKYPTIIAAALTPNSDGTWSMAVTLSSTYDTPERYADGWRVLDEQGNIIGDRPLGHDHQGEQPFTRSTSGIVIPEGTSTLTIEARDQQYGWSPDTFTIEVPEA